MKLDTLTVSMTDDCIRRGAKRGDPAELKRFAVIESRIRSSLLRSVSRNGGTPLPSDLAAISREIRRLAAQGIRPGTGNARMDALCRKAKALNAAERAAARKTPAPKPAAPNVLHAPNVIRARAEWVNPETANRHELRDGALRILERAARRLSPAQVDHVEELLRSSTENRDSAEICRRVLVTENPNYVSAFWKTMQDGPIAFTTAERLALERYRELFRSEIRAAEESGTFGLAIPATIDPTIVIASGETAPIVRRARQVTITTNVYKAVAADAPSWSFQAEGATVADDSPTLTQPVLDVHTARGFIPASQELVQDYPGFVDEFTTLLAAGYQDLLSAKSAAGTGTGEPTGVFTRMANTTTNPAHVVVTTAGTIGAVDVRAAWDALPERFLANSSWTMHRRVLAQIRNLEGAAAQVDLVVDRLGTTIMGRPVVVTDYAPDFTGTTGTENFLVVGDLSGYMVATRAGMTVEMIQQMRGVTGRPLGQRGFFASARVAMDVVNPSALRLLANS